MVSFVKSNFPSTENFALTFQDEDGDAVTIANQMDVDAMKEMNEGKEIVRIDVVKSDTEEIIIEQEGVQKQTDKYDIEE